MTILRILTLTILCTLAAPLPGQVRTWVSVSGSDAADCSRETPCRNFAAAIAAVAEGGEVVVMDSGGFGSVSVDKGVSLIAPNGVHAAIAPTTGTAINITSATGTVILRNLYLNAQGASQGIRYAGPSDLTVTNCVANGFTSYGFITSVAALGAAYVSHSVFRNNGNQGFRYLADSPGEVVIDDCRFEGNALGGLASVGTAEFTVRNSVSYGNGNAGFVFQSGEGQEATLIGCVATGNEDSGFFATNNKPGTTQTMHLEKCTSSGNGTGVRATDSLGGSTDVYVSNSVMIYNGTGIGQNGAGEVHSRGNNTLENNTLGNDFTAPGFLAK